MKKISELGLELIELEGDLLLVRGGQIPDNWYLDDANQIRESVIDDPEYWEGRLGYKSIIASTKKYEGLPLLVIEDEVSNLSKEAYKKHSVNDDRLSLDEQIQRTGGFNIGYKEGYNKAKETFKFTEEDMIEFSIWRSTTIFSEPLTPIGQFEKWKSLTKKELWIEVEEWSLAENVEAKNQNVPKITNNQIKGIYR